MGLSNSQPHKAPQKHAAFKWIVQGGEQRSCYHYIRLCVVFLIRETLRDRDDGKSLSFDVGYMGLNSTHSSTITYQGMILGK